MDATDDTLAADQTLAAQGDVTAPPRRRDGRLGPGDVVGRYSILDRLGAGGMGVVYAAYDPELDRRVAIKLLLADSYGSSQPGDPAQARLIREARALARLTHPNVVTVHDVGAHGDSVFVAMEYVDGQTLTAWMEAERTRDEILDVFIRAARGLAAAHDAGMVHRDFKPDNVMIGKDGRVRVMDFGLVQSSGRAEAGEEAGQATGDRGAPEILTRTGAIMGTPRYMAPEQHAGDEVDARTDQFSFCVALHEALYGVRPFPGESLHELALSVTRGELVEPPADASVPAWMRGVILRGLAVNRSERHPSMGALVQALEDDPARRRRRFMGMAAGGVALLATAAGGYGLATAGAPTCEEAGVALASVWSEARARQLQEAFVATGEARAGDAWIRIEADVNAFVDAWSTQRVDACEATHVRREQSARMLDRRMACLDRRREVLESRLEIWAEPDAALVGKALSSGASLPDLVRCSDTEALEAAVPPPEDPEVASRVAELTPRLARAGTLEYAGRYEEATTQARAVVEAATEAGWDPLRAEALYRLGALEDRTGAYEQSERDLEAAYFTALAAGHLETAVDAATKLIHVAADELGHDQAGLLWARHGEAVLARFGSNHRQAAWLHNNAGNVLLRTGQPALALASYERALDRLQQAVGSDHPDLGVVLENLGRTRHRMGDPEVAAEHLGRALDLRERGLGPGHPHVAGTLHGLAKIMAEQGDHDGAVEHLRRALRIRLDTIGPDHRQTAEIQLALARELAATGAKGEEPRDLARSARKTYANDPAQSETVKTIDTFLAGLEPEAEAPAP